MSFQLYLERIRRIAAELAELLEQRVELPHRWCWLSVSDRVERTTSCNAIPF